jgi:cell division protein FtsZ
MMERYINEVRREIAPVYPGGSSDLKIVVIGVGGAGNNTIDRLARMGVSNAKLVAVNTDKQHLSLIGENPNIECILIGESVTRGLGAGGYPDIAKKAMEISKSSLEPLIQDANIVFICAGMGGGTGTGASPVIAQMAREQGAIVISIVTYPFRYERDRCNKALKGIQELSEYSNTVIVIDNNKLIELMPNMPANQAFAEADKIIAKTIDGLVHTLTIPSRLNIDFADLKAVMSKGGVAMVCVGEGKGMNKVEEAVRSALHNKLLDISIKGAKGALVHITAGNDFTMGDLDIIMDELTRDIDPMAAVKPGLRVRDDYENKIEVIAIYTGLQNPYIGSNNRGYDNSLFRI